MTTRTKTKYPGIWERGDRYQVWYRCSGCKPNGTCQGHTETLPAGSLLTHAKNRRAELVNTVAKGGLLVGKKVRLAEYAPKWLETQKWRLQPSTYDLYETGIRHWIIPNLGQRYVSEISIDDVAKLVSKMTKSGLKRNSIKGYLRPLSRMMSHAVRGGLAASNPVKGVDKDEWPKADQRVMRILSSEEIELLLRPTISPDGKNPPLNDNFRPLITFLIFTGLRITEALNVKWEDIDLDAGMVTVNVSKTQAGTGRSVILIPALVSILRHHRLRSAYSAPESYVFPNAKGRVGDRRYILSKVLKPAIKAAGVTEVTLHELRHTFASILISMGMEPTFVAEQLGHADAGVTMSRYAHLMNPEARRDDAREKLQQRYGGLL